MQKTWFKRVLSLALVLMIGLTGLSLTASAAGQPVLAAGTAAGEPGEFVRVNVTLVNNPGIVAIRFYVQYDKAALKLVKAENGTLFPDSSSTFKDDLTADPYAMLWADSTATQNMTQDGVLAKLTFEILDVSAGSTPVELVIDNENTFNYDMDNAAFETQSGSIEIREKSFTATFTVDGNVYNERQYHAGDVIEVPVAPTKEGFIFKGWSPAVPDVMPAGDITFTAAFEEIKNPVLRESDVSLTASKTVYAKESFKLVPDVTFSGTYTVSYDTSDNRIVSVDREGNVTANKRGNADVTVTVKDTNGNTVIKKCSVTVNYKWWQWLIIIFLFGWIWY